MSTVPATSRARGPLGWFRDPWRKPRLLEGMTWIYLAWSILPVIIAVIAAA